MKFSVSLLLPLGCLLATVSGSSSESESENLNSPMSSSASEAEETLDDIITRLVGLEVPAQKDNENFGEYLKGIQKTLSTFDLADMQRDDTDSSAENLNQEAWSAALQNITKIKAEISALKEKAIAYNTGLWRNKYLRWVNGHYITDALKLHTEIMASVTTIQERLGERAPTDLGEKPVEEVKTLNDSADLDEKPVEEVKTLNDSADLGEKPVEEVKTLNASADLGEKPVEEVKTLNDLGEKPVKVVETLNDSANVIEDPTGKKVSFIRRHKRSLVVIGVVIILVAGALTGAYFILGH